MANAKFKEFSRRTAQNLEFIIPKIQHIIDEQTKKVSSAIDLSTAENFLLRPELLLLSQQAAAKGLESEVNSQARQLSRLLPATQHLSYPRGFAGDPAVLGVLSTFLNTHFNPSIPVAPSHIATAPGASSCLDALFYNFCDPGEGILIPGPYWYGFDFLVQTRCQVVPIPARTKSLSSALTEDIIEALQQAYETAPCKVKAVLISNPNNPLGQTYPQPVLENLIKFCYQHSLHIVSDEVYAMCYFDSPDAVKSTLFTSILSLDIERLGCDGSKVHAVWSPSKDFGLTGFRLGCVISQSNQSLINGLALASTRQVSTLSNVVVQHLLQSASLPTLIQTNKLRLRTNYKILIAFLKSRGIEYIPCCAALFVLARLAPQPDVTGAEMLLVKRFREVDVIVCAGSDYHLPDSETGWVRIGFAVETVVLKEALTRIDSVLGGLDGACGILNT